MKDKKWENGRIRLVTEAEWKAAGSLVFWHPTGEWKTKQVGTIQEWKACKYPPNVQHYMTASSFVWRGGRHNWLFHGPTVEDVKPAYGDWPYKFTRPFFDTVNYPSAEVTFEWFTRRLADLGNPSVMTPPHITKSGTWRATIRVNGHSVTLTSPNGLSWCSMSGGGSLWRLKYMDFSLKSPAEERLKARRRQFAENGRDPNVPSIELTGEDLQTYRENYFKRYGVAGYIPGNIPQWLMTLETERSALVIRGKKFINQIPSTAKTPRGPILSLPDNGQDFDDEYSPYGEFGHEDDWLYGHGPS